MLMLLVVLVCQIKPSTMYCTALYCTVLYLTVLPCTVLYCTVLQVCQIKPSTMYFTQTKMSSLEAAGHDRLVSVSQGGSNYRVCYSNHASLAELRQLVRA